MKITVDIGSTCEVSASFDGIGIIVAVELSKPGCALENVSIANVTNDTAPEATDKLFLWRAVKGWFYIYYQKLISIFFAGGGFKANLYFTARDSEVEGYKLLSYQNDAEPTTLTASLNSSYQLLRTYIFNLPYGDTTIPEGLWKSILYGRVSSAVGDTTLRLDGFMRNGAGVETQIFSVESSSIKNTTLDDIPNEQWLPQLTVDPDSFFGVKLYGKTTKGGGVTLTTVVGGANASYLITPAAVEHNLARRRDVADCHPAKAITFDVDPVPNFTAVVKGNTMEAITHKVAGLQLQNKLNVLGNISGVIGINLANGFKVTGTLTDAVVLSFTGLPPSGYSYSLNLLFTNIEAITFPVGTKFAGGVAPTVISSPYRIFCEIDSAGVAEVQSVIDNINTPV